MKTLELKVKKTEVVPPCQYTREQLMKSIKESEEDIRYGRVTDQDKVFEEIEKMIVE